MGILILIQESLSRACIRHVNPPLVTKAVEGNDTRPSTGVEQQELAKHYFKILYVGHFSGVAQQREPKLINPFCKLIEIKFVCSTFKIKNFFNVKDPFPDRLRVRIVYQFSCASYTNVMLVTLAKQADILPSACASTCHRTDPLTFISIYRL